MAPVALVAALVLLLVVAGRAAVQADRADEATRRLLAAAAPRREAPGWFLAVLGRLDLDVDPSRAWRGGSGAVALGAVGVAWRHPASIGVAGAVAAVVAVGCVVVPAISRRRRSDRSGVDAAVVVELLVAPLGAGATLGQAVAHAARRTGPTGPLGRALGELRRAVDEGAPVQDAFDDWARAERADGLCLVADALAVAGATGGSRVAALLGVGETVRERAALAREVRALGAQARTSAVVLAVTPLAFSAAVALADGRVAAFLFTTPAGWGCLLVGSAADAVGWWWMQRLVGGVS